MEELELNCKCLNYLSRQLIDIAMGIHHLLLYLGQRNGSLKLNKKQEGNQLELNQRSKTKKSRRIKMDPQLTRSFIVLLKN
jgi:hypothetical protein